MENEGNFVDGYYIAKMFEDREAEQEDDWELIFAMADQPDYLKEHEMQRKRASEDLYEEAVETFAYEESIEKALEGEQE
jgi:hypothetical protein